MGGLAAERDTPDQYRSERKATMWDDSQNQQQHPLPLQAQQDRYVERMRRRTSSRLNNPDTIDEARRAGAYVADRVMQRAASRRQLQSQSQRFSRSLSGAPLVGERESSSSGGLAAATGRDSSSELFYSTAAARRSEAGVGGNAMLETIPSFDLSAETSHHPNHHGDDDDATVKEGNVRSIHVSEEKECTGNFQVPDHRRHPHHHSLFSRRSSERAVLRGSWRGLREPNEREVVAMESSLQAPYHPSESAAVIPPPNAMEDDDNLSEYSDFDLTTLTDAFTDFTTKESELRRRRNVTQQQPTKEEKKKWGAARPAKPKWWSSSSGSKSKTKRRRKSGGYSGGAVADYYPSHDYSSDGDEDLDGHLDDAWMCGVCGQVFPTLEVAERHEDQHLRRVIEKLGWTGAYDGNLGPSTPAVPASPNDALREAAARTSENLHNIGFLEPGQHLRGVSSATSRVGYSGGRRQRFDSSDSIPELKIFRSAGTDVGGVTDGTQRPSNLRMAADRFYSVRHSSCDEEIVEEKTISTTAAPRGRPAPLKNHNRLVSAGQYRSDLPEDTLIPTKRRPRLTSGSFRSEVRFEEAPSGVALAGGVADQQETLSFRRGADGITEDPTPCLLMPDAMQNYVVLADEALLNVCQRATPFILSPSEVRAERHLEYLGRDKAYYDDIVNRALARRTNPSNRFRSDATDTIRGKVQNKLLDAYQLMKEGDPNFARKDVYHHKKKAGSAEDESSAIIHHSTSTMYVNVLVRNSVQVVKHELERLAREKWEHPDEDKGKYTRFELFRVYAHANMVKLAGLALASDFTPRRIAIQLSNDIYRLLTPRLKRRGVTIGTEIEYRVGGYFVLAVNINTVDWARLIKTNNKDLKARKAKWKKESTHKQHDEDAEDPNKGRLSVLFSILVAFCRRLSSFTKYDLIDHILAWFFYVHWLVYLPICKLAYASPGIGMTIRKFIISSAIDEICYYVHEKGMEMEIRILRAQNQASFMLSALREIRADGLELKKKRQETEAQEVGAILGPLLGPKIKEDQGPPVIPSDFEQPANLAYIGLEIDLPVGFRRLRWAYLSRKSTFVTEAFWKTESKYENITISDWSKQSEFIGDPNPPSTVNVDDYIGAEIESSYLMPKSAFVSANMSYAKSQLIAYNDYCFCVKTQSRNPDAPFGSTFVAWTQVLVIDMGNNSCKLICSVEAEFPNGPPMVARQIQSGMRAGTGESFVLLGETISKYANAFP